MNGDDFNDNGLKNINKELTFIRLELKTIKEMVTAATEILHDEAYKDGWTACEEEMQGGRDE